MTEREKILREIVQDIWREVNNHSDKVELVASDKEWEFFLKLMEFGR